MIKKSIITILSIHLILLNFCGSNNTASNHPKASPPKPSQSSKIRQPQPKNNHRHQQKRNRFGQDNMHRLQQTVISLSEKEKSQVHMETVTVEEKPILSTLKAMGKVLAPIDKKAIVGYAFPGRILKINAALGQWVKTGTPLITLECEEVGKAKSDYLKTFTECRLAQQNFEREERLFTKDIGAKKDLLETKAQLEIACSNLEAAEKKLLVMGFSKNQVQEFSVAKNITPLVSINAPIDGRVIQINTFPGAMIEPSTEIMILLNPTTLCIDAEIYEKDLAKIKLNQEVRITVPAYPSETFTGRISYIGDTVHPETRTITVRTQVPNKDFKLKPGMFADIGIQLDRKEKALTIPTEAVLDNLDQKIVFTLESGSFICKTVETGTTFDGYIEITKGLKAGETVIVKGNYQLKSKLYEQTLHQAHVH